MTSIAKEEILMTEPMTDKNHQELVKLIYKPFHEKINELKSSLQKPCYHLDLHSMPSVGTAQHKDPGERRADIVVSDQLGKLAETAFRLGTVRLELSGAVRLPMSELNRLRREATCQLEAQLVIPPVATLDEVRQTFRALPGEPIEVSELAVLCRSLEQIEAAAEAGADRIYLDFEDIRFYRLV